MMSVWPTSGAAVRIQPDLGCDGRHPAGVLAPRVVGGGGCRLGRRPPPQDIGAAADFAAEQTALAGQRVGAPHGADGHAHVIGEIALRGQLRALGKTPALMSSSIRSARRR